MMYLDTNVIISYIDTADPNHERAVKLLEAHEGERRVVTWLILVELASVYSRAGLENPPSLALYSVRHAGAEVADLDFGRALRLAFELAPRLRLKTLNLLHVVACKVIGGSRFATFDKDVISKSVAVEETLGVEVVTA